MNNETKSATATPTGSIVVKSPAFSTLSKDHQCKICNRVGANMQKNGEWYHAACVRKNSDIPPVSKAGKAALERSKLVSTVVEESCAKVAETPVKVVTAKVSEAPVSKAPAKVSEAPAKVSEARAEVSKAPAKVSEAHAKVSESAKIVVLSEGEEDTPAPGCPILAITIQGEKAVDQLEVITKNFKEYLDSLPADQRNACIEAASAHVGKLEDQCKIMKEKLPTPEQHKAKEENIRGQMATNLDHQGEIAKQIRLREEKKAEWRNAMRIAADNEDASKDDELGIIVDRLKAEIEQFPKDLEKQRQDAIAQGNELNTQLQRHTKYDMVEMKKNLDAWTTFVDGLRTMVIGVDADDSSWDGGSHDTGMCYDYNVNQRFTADQIKNFRNCLRYHLEHTLTDERIEEVVQKNYHDVPAYLLYSIKSLYDPAMKFDQQNRALFFKGVIDNGQPYDGFNPWTVCADEEVLAKAARTVKERGERSEDEETERSDDEAGSSEGEEHESEVDEGEEDEGEEHESEVEEELSPTTKADIFGEESCDEESPAPKTPKRMSPTVKAAQIAKAQKQEAEVLKAAQAAEKAEAMKAKAAEAEAAQAAKAAKAAKAQAAQAKAAEAEAAKAAKAQAAEAKAKAAEAAKAKAAETAKAKAQAAEAAKAKATKAAEAAKAKATKAAEALDLKAAKFDDEESDSDAEVTAKPVKRARDSTDAQEEGERLKAQAATTLRNLDPKDIQEARKNVGRTNPVRACSTPTSNVHFTLSGKCGAWESVTSSSQGRSSGDKIERVMEEILCKSKNGQQSCCGGKFIPNKNTTVVIICNSIRLSQNTGNYEANVQAIETYTREGTDPVYFVAYVYNGKACYNMVYPPVEAPAPKKARKGK